MSNWIEAVHDEDLQLLVVAIDEKINSLRDRHTQIREMTWLHTDDYQTILNRNNKAIERFVKLQLAITNEHVQRIREKVPSPE